VLWTDLVRIYRCGFTQRHDLSLALDDTDIYGEDVWGRLLPDDDVVLVPNEWGHSRWQREDSLACTV